LSLPKRKFTASELIHGQTYRVTTTFEDYDGIVHSVGESWQFAGKDFLPYDDGLTSYIENGEKTVPFRLQWHPETQGQLINDFSDFVEEM
jgi:hypothetical protein